MDLRPASKCPLRVRGGHLRRTTPCPLWANSGLVRRNKRRLFHHFIILPLKPAGNTLSRVFTAPKVAKPGYAAATGRNLAKAMSVIIMKITNTTPCVIANGGSDCVGANALRPDTFIKLCAMRTKTFR